MIGCLMFLLNLLRNVFFFVLVLLLRASPRPHLDHHRALREHIFPTILNTRQKMTTHSREYILSYPAP
ncbi:hypothetical protein BDR04DRAFT_784608 [Suillus decipiens]|nr:hypothetical protein BDR04DRAFT_784608 [Suillus decipiens]